MRIVDLHRQNPSEECQEDVQVSGRFIRHRAMIDGAPSIGTPAAIGAPEPASLGVAKMGQNTIAKEDEMPFV